MKTTTLLRCGLLSLAIMAEAGCQRPTVPLEAPRDEVFGLPPGKTDEVASERRLAMMRPTDARPVDALLASLQERGKRMPDKLDTWLQLGNAWIRKARETAEPGYYRNAEACATIALHLDPTSSLAQNLHAMVLLSDHQFHDALKAAEAVLKRNDFDPLALATLSDALLELGRIEGAEEAVQQMVSLKPNLPSYSRASYLYFLRGNHLAAKQAIRLAIDASPGKSKDPEPRAWALTQAANIFWHEGDYGGADAGYEMALRNFPDFPPALVGRGQVAMAEGRYRDAAGYFDVAYRLSPLAETAWLLGDARTLAGDSKGAADAYETLLRTGRRTDPRTVALYLANHGGDLTEAEQLIGRERNGRNDLYTQDIYAFVLFRKGKLAEARTAIDAVLEIGIKDARILYHAAEIHAVTGDTKGARELAADALKRNPHFDLHGKQAAQKLLASLGPAPSTTATTPADRSLAAVR